jgi:prolipoprotein diacylglyceryltransferase
MGTIGVAPNPLVHDLWVALGVLAAVLWFRHEQRRRAVTDERLWVIVGFGLGWGALFARLGTWVGARWADPKAGIVEHFLHGNRSILGGLAGAYAGILFAKKVTGYRMRTGALFAPAVALGMAVGRVGCLLTELPGTPTGSSFGIVLSPDAAAAFGVPPGVALHPSFVYEIAFHLVAFALIVRFRDGLPEPAGLFTLWLTGYAVFRFLVEFVRGNEVVALGLTWPQLLLLLTIPLLLWRSAHALRAGEPILVPSSGVRTHDVPNAIG